MKADDTGESGYGAVAMTFASHKADDTGDANADADDDESEEEEEVVEENEEEEKEEKEEEETSRALDHTKESPPSLLDAAQPLEQKILEGQVDSSSTEVAQLFGGASHGLTSFPHRQTGRIRGRTFISKLCPAASDGARDIRPSIPDRPVQHLDLPSFSPKPITSEDAPRMPAQASATPTPKAPPTLHRGPLVPLLKQGTPVLSKRNRPRTLSPLQEKSKTTVQLGIGLPPPQTGEAKPMPAAAQTTGCARELTVTPSLRRGKLEAIVPSKPGLQSLGRPDQRGKFAEYIAAKNGEGGYEEPDRRHPDWSLLRMLDPDEDLPVGMRRRPADTSPRSLSRALLSSSARFSPPAEPEEVSAPQQDSRKRGAYLPAGSVFTPAQGIFDPFGGPGNSFGWMAREKRKTLRVSTII